MSDYINRGETIMCQKVDSIEKFLEQLPRLNEKMKGNIFYRGQSDVSYRLTPSILRRQMEQKENDIYMNILAECSHEFESTMSHIDVLSKMQHYGVPTRLLDVTRNALVALYFACDSKNNIDKDGVVYVLRENSNHVKQFDSDAVSILSCLPRFSLEEKLEIKQLADSAQLNKISDEYTDEQIDSFNSNKTIKRLLHEVKKEKPAFENIINPDDLLSNFFLNPQKTNPRIIRQSGAFIIWGLKISEMQINSQYDDNVNSDVSYRIIIDRNYKQDIINQLSCFGISKATLHPELYKVAEYIRETYDSFNH